MSERPSAPALVIVPTYNERDNVTEMAVRLFAGGADIELLVVDDGSPDGTAEVVRDLAQDRDDVHLIERRAKTGLGDAYVEGFRWALERGYDAVVEMDADLSHDPTAVPSLLAGLADADLVIGSRYVDGGRIENWGNFRRLLSRFGNLYANALLRFGVNDATSGFRAFRSQVLHDQDLSTVASHGYAFQIEMIRRVIAAGGVVSEIPITFVEREAGESKMSKRIVMEALAEVTWWGIKDRWARSRRRPSS